MNNDWIIWNGGECPVPLGTKVQRQLRNKCRLDVEEGREYDACKLDWNWDADQAYSDIIAYRIVPEPVRETVTLWTQEGEFVCGTGLGFATRRRYLGSTIRLTFDRVDGEIDWTTLRGEKVE